MVVPGNNPLSGGYGNHSMKNLNIPSSQSVFTNAGPAGSFLPGGGAKKKKTLKLRDNKYDYFLKAFAT
jgi:hypothetical protein